MLLFFLFLLCEIFVCWRIQTLSIVTLLGMEFNGQHFQHSLCGTGFQRHQLCVQHSEALAVEGGHMKRFYTLVTFFTLAKKHVIYFKNLSKFHPGPSQSSPEKLTQYITFGGSSSGSVSKESACIAGDPGSLPGSGRSPLVHFLGQEDPLKKGMTTRSSILAWRTTNP